jgi:hypothetical protein
MDVQPGAEGWQAGFVLVQCRGAVRAAPLRFPPTRNKGDSRKGRRPRVSPAAPPESGESGERLFTRRRPAAG